MFGRHNTESNGSNDRIHRWPPLKQVIHRRLESVTLLLFRQGETQGPDRRARPIGTTGTGVAKPSVGGLAGDVKTKRFINGFLRHT